jgi:hypothetical protein
MKHIDWDYKGYNDLGLIVDDETYMQYDWNATLLTRMNMAFDDDDFDKGMNIFASKKIIDEILSTIVAYDEETNSLFNKKIIPLDIDTPKIYITKPEVLSFTDITHHNHGSVTVKNY